MSEKVAEAPANGTEPIADVAHTSLAEALLAAQMEMPAVEPDKTNPHFKSKFVSLGNLLSKVRPVLNRNGLVLMQAPDLDEGRFVLRTTVMHSSGESISFAAPLSPAKDDPQGQGSAITYMRRYAAAAAFAIADQEDDDGNAAASNGGAAQAVRREGQGDGKSSQATAPQRRKIHALASNLGLTEPQLRAWIEWNAGTPHTDRIEKKQASTLIEMLEAYEDGPDALAAFNGALEGEDEKAQRIAAKYSSSAAEGSGE